MAAALHTHFACGNGWCAGNLIGEDMHASATALRRPRSGIRPEILSPGVGLTYGGQGRISLHVTVVQQQDAAALAPAYSPQVGRWLSNDPIGISGGLNQYAAFSNNPVGFVDPEGEVALLVTAGLVAGSFIAGYGLGKGLLRAYDSAVETLEQADENARHAERLTASDLTGDDVNRYMHSLTGTYDSFRESAIDAARIPGSSLTGPVPTPPQRAAHLLVQLVTQLLGWLNRTGC